MSKFWKLPPIATCQAVAAAGDNVDNVVLDVNSTCPARISDAKMTKLFGEAGIGISPSAASRHAAVERVLLKYKVNDPNSAMITALAGGPVW